MYIFFYSVYIWTLQEYFLRFITQIVLLVIHEFRTVSFRVGHRCIFYTVTQFIKLYIRLTLNPLSYLYVDLSLKPRTNIVELSVFLAHLRNQK